MTWEPEVEIRRLRDALPADFRPGTSQYFAVLRLLDEQFSTRVLSDLMGSITDQHPAVVNNDIAKGWSTATDEDLRAARAVIGPLLDYYASHADD